MILKMKTLSSIDTTEKAEDGVGGAMDNEALFINFDMQHVVQECCNSFGRMSKLGANCESSCTIIIYSWTFGWDHPLYRFTQKGQGVRET